VRVDTASAFVSCQGPRCLVCVGCAWRVQVLSLDIDATDEDVRSRYKKLSILVHPDKNIDNKKDAQVPKARRLRHEVVGVCCCVGGKGGGVACVAFLMFTMSTLPYSSLRHKVAFDELKKAHEELMDPEKKDLFVATIEGTRHATAKEHRRLLSKGLREEDDPLPDKLVKAVAKAFAGELPEARGVSSKFFLFRSSRFCQVGLDPPEREPTS